MARARDPARDKAKEMYLNSEGKMLLKDIAAELGKSDSQIRKWKNQDGWNDELNGNVTNGANGNVTNEEVVKTIPKDIEIVVETFEEETEQNVELSDVQRFFCLYYIKYLNATKAYQKAYETTYQNADSNAYRLMGKDGIRTEISRLKKARAAGIMLEQNDVLQKYIDIAFADIGDYVEYGTEDIEMRDGEGKLILDDDGYPKTFKRSFVHLKDGQDLDNTIVSEVKLGRDGMSVKLHDKMKALDVLAKFTDLLSERQLKQLQVEKVKAETDFAQMRAAKLRGDKKDTSMLQTLLEGQQQFEEMAMQGAFEQFEKKGDES